MTQRRPHRSLTVVLASLVLVALPWCAASQAQSSGGFKVIVHTDRPEDALSSDDLSRLFLKKTSRWDDGSKVVAYDQERSSTARRSFLSQVHDMDENDYAKYWVKLVFSGRARAPEVLGGDAAVVAAVTSDPAAIGYVSPGASVPGTVKVLQITN